ncbi:hypothetical protein H257_14084 [Aphanomyces astaci]|uniref:Palmitoyltransferase n=1 Tax=Aphanomyces astaci TaxID=112090 RepID=W4FSF7_APHAT|nr:hypothetical protein H257_14084 [Aphanomyces astaci]ETV70407.1 hypothetical protein H257_14084 [Aphanomyces astaci]|eukprot:XP_009840119.1 hypothetical protein H257_14084 [Aphanomyces astaci]
MTRVTRIQGFQRPFSRDQVTSWVLQPVLIAAFVALTTSYLPGLLALWVLIPYGVFVAVFGVCWFLCEVRNPASPTAVAKWCVPVPSKPTRYCTVCNKNSPGLDHHCTWLNTCIGDNNYEPFFILIVSGTVLTSYQAVVGILMASTWHADIAALHSPTGNTSGGALAALWIHNAVCIILAIAYGALTSFHVYLLVLRMGTYDYILKHGANNRFLWLLRCQCHKKAHAAKKKNTPKNHPPFNDQDSISTVTTTTSDRKASKSKVGHTSSVQHSSKESCSAPSSSDISAWKAEWLKKHGGDGDENDDDGCVRSTEPSSENDMARTRKVSANTILVEVDGALPSSPSSVAPMAANGNESFHDVDLCE